jgi:preprotein translocase subunit SecF
MSGLATRLYRGEAGINVVARRRLWFTIAGVALLIAIMSFAIRGFHLGVEFTGGNQFQVPASVGTLTEVEEAFTEAGAEVVSGQQVGRGGDGQYLIRTQELTAEQTSQLKTDIGERFDLDPSTQISDDLVSGSWGGDVTRRALYGLVIFIVLVMAYLVLRFEWRMAVGAVASLVLDLVLTAGVYSLVGFEVTPSTVIGFLTILGFALYDVVVVFDKVQENTRSITGSSTQTYGEAANLAVNQTLMRSINTAIVALLPVGGLLFIGAGLLGAGTLKDLSLVLFVGMGVAVYSSIFFATPVLVALKEQEPRYKNHTQRVLARRQAIAEGRDVPGTRGRAARQAKQVPATAEATGSAPAPEAELAGSASAGSAPGGSAPKAGARPGGKRPSGARGGRPGGGRPRGGAKRR